MANPNAHWGRLIGASVLVLAAAFVGPWLIPAPDLEENRLLADAPAPPSDLAGWLEALPVQRGLTAERRERLVELIRSVARPSR